jgi:hypothetical protein
MIVIRTMDEPRQPTPDEGLFAFEQGATGVEVEDTSTEDISEPFDPSLIRVESKSMTIDLVMSRIGEGEIDLSPGFQRKAGIWTETAQSRLIESLLIRIPLPAFYMDGTNDDRWLVVDGLQRLTTLKRFVIEKELVLSGLEFLTAFHGRRFNELPRNFQRRIMETQITVFVIQENTPASVKFNIFRRINTGGLPLSAQEIRHALNQGPAADLLVSLARAIEFQRATAGSIRDDRMADCECVLRFMAFTMQDYSQYKSKEFDVFLNSAMSELNRMNAAARNSHARTFTGAMNVCSRVFGEHAFRKQYHLNDPRSPINKALFEVWSVILGSQTDTDAEQLIARRNDVRERFMALMSDRRFDASISQGTGDINKVKYRFSKIEELVGEVLGA